MDILPGLVAMVAGSHQPLAHRRVNLQIDHLIGRGQAQQVVFIVKEPLQECVPLLRREFRALMHGIGGGVAVSDQDAAFLVELAPVRLIPRIAVHRIKAGCRVGVDIVRLVTKLPGQIHLDQRTGITVIIREGDLSYQMIRHRQVLCQQLSLRALAAAVQPFQNDQLTFAHTPASCLMASYFARTSAVLPQHILPSGQGPLTQAGPALAKIWGATG